MNNNDKLRQIRVPKQLYLAVKSYCLNSELTMSKLYEQMLTWFFNTHQSNETTYYASYKKGHILSLWIPDHFAEKIKNAAYNARVSDARIIFTALVMYLKEIKLYNYR